MYSIYIYLPVPAPEAQVRYIRYAGRAHLRMDTLILSTYILTYVSTFEKVGVLGGQIVYAT